MKYPLILLVALAGFTGCIRYYCHAQDSITVYVSRDWKGFSDSTATLIRFQGGSNFVMLLDSSVSQLQYEPDSSAPFWAVAAGGLKPGYDYKIIFRPSGQQRNITKLTINRKKVPRGTDGVVSCGGSYTVDGVTTSVSDYIDDVSGYTESPIRIYLYQ